MARADISAVNLRVDQCDVALWRNEEAAMRQYLIELEANTPLLMHADNIEWADEMEAWKNNPENKKLSKAGDDRSPAFRWIGSLYNDGSHVSLPQENMARCLMDAATMVPVPGGRSGKTFKSQSMSGIQFESTHLEFTVGGRQIPMAEINKLRDEMDFKVHLAAVKKLGFSLYTKRARIGTSKHIRVRPRFDDWAVTGTLIVHDEQITEEVLRLILVNAGRYKGLGDWRPGGKTPGSFGMFTVSMEEI